MYANDTAITVSDNTINTPKQILQERYNPILSVIKYNIINTHFQMFK